MVMELKLLIADNRLRHVDVAEYFFRPAQFIMFHVTDDFDLRPLIGNGVIIRMDRIHQSDPVVQTQFFDDVLHPLMQIDGAFVNFNSNACSSSISVMTTSFSLLMTWYLILSMLRKLKSPAGKSDPTQLNFPFSILNSPASERTGTISSSNGKRAMSSSVSGNSAAAARSGQSGCTNCPDRSRRFHFHCQTAIPD